VDAKSPRGRRHEAADRHAKRRSSPTTLTSAASAPRTRGGEFGILPHHADFVTALSVSVVGWRRASGQQGYCAVRGGLLTISGGEDVAIATREAILGDDLASLEAVVRAQARRRGGGGTPGAFPNAEQFRIQAIRQIIGYLRPEDHRRWGRSGMSAPPAGPSSEEDIKKLARLGGRAGRAAGLTGRLTASGRSPKTWQ